MDDTVKIKVLMIYFEHWGKEEARIYKNLEGLKQFHQQIHKNYHSRYETAFQALQKMDKKTHRFWYSMIHCLLPRMDHWVEYYESISQPLYTKIKFAENIGATFYDVAHLNVSHAQMKNVDAIVALPTLNSIQ